MSPRRVARYGRFLANAIGVAIIAVGCGSGGGSSGGGSASGDFVSYWTDDVDWCRFLANCAVMSEPVCHATWPTREEVQAGITGITTDSRARCETTSRAVDDCVLHQTCEEYQAQTKC